MNFLDRNPAGQHVSQFLPWLYMTPIPIWELSVTTHTVRGQPSVSHFSMSFSPPLSLNFLPLLLLLPTSLLHSSSCLLCLSPSFRWLVWDPPFKSFLLGSQDLKVNLCGLQQDKCSDGKGKNDVGIAGQFPCYSYTVGPYGKGPTGNYTTCTHNNQ